MPTKLSRQFVGYFHLTVTQPRPFVSARASIPGIYIGVLNDHSLQCMVRMSWRGYSAPADT
jgi:hypothetical protein